MAGDVAGDPGGNCRDDEHAHHHARPRAHGEYLDEGGGAC